MALDTLIRSELTPTDQVRVFNVNATYDKEAIVTLEEFRSIEPTVNPGTTAAIPIATGTVIFNKTGSLFAGTLAAPTALQNGTRITFISDSAFAHTITATGLLHDGVTGGAKNLATFAAFKGATLTLYAYNLFWYVENRHNCTIS
jgi:hypothetical protein